MRHVPLCLLFLAAVACSGAESDPAAPAGNAAAPASSAAPAAAPELAGLPGLYEGGDAQRPHRMCIVEKDGDLRFGLVVWGANDHSCSGSGTATRDGAALRLAMAGDEACTLDARIDGNKVTMPAQIPSGCTYYCGARATLADVALTQTGTAPEDIAKARDIVGDPLCG